MRRSSNSNYENYDGQGLLAKVTQATGGGNYCGSTGEPVSVSPCFDEITRRLQNQYQLSFHSQLKGKSAVQSIELKVSDPAAEVRAPQRVFVTNSSGE